MNTLKDYLVEVTPANQILSITEYDEVDERELYLYPNISDERDARVGEPYILTYGRDTLDAYKQVMIYLTEHPVKSPTSGTLASGPQ